jgi:hypothetical protein
LCSQQRTDHRDRETEEEQCALSEHQGVEQDESAGFVLPLTALLLASAMALLLLEAVECLALAAMPSRRMVDNDTQAVPKKTGARAIHAGPMASSHTNLLTPAPVISSW